jgi:LPXTG-motif cell wall-anchored protein
MHIARTRAKALTAMGIITMLFGALLIMAPSAAADPPGNNGFVKIDGLGEVDGPGHSVAPNDPDDNGPDNDPHIDCGIQLEFFDFDLEQTADVVFWAHPPTGAVPRVAAEEELGVEISGDDAAGGSEDLDLVKTYTLDPAAFTSTHPTHGWHVVLDLTIYDAEGDPVPGAQKHKAFWFVNDCTPPPCVDTPEIAGNECLPPCVDTPEIPGNECLPPCTVNCGEIPPPPPPIEEVDPSNLTVTKAVTGEIPADGWSFPFTVTDLGGFDLTDESSSSSNEVDAGTYTITETDAGDADLTSVDCTGEGEVVDLVAGTVTVEIAEGASVTCTFTNDFPAVEPSVVVNEPEPEPEETAVLGSQVVRSLPRTGSGSRSLATVGAVLIMLGAAVTLSSRRLGHAR